MSERHPYDKGKPEKDKAEKKCPKCDGKGRISVPGGKREPQCPLCDGTGWVKGS